MHTAYHNLDVCVCLGNTVQGDPLIIQLPQILSPLYDLHSLWCRFNCKWIELSFVSINI